MYTNQCVKPNNKLCKLQKSIILQILDSKCQNQLVIESIYNINMETKNIYNGLGQKVQYILTGGTGNRIKLTIH